MFYINHVQSMDIFNPDVHARQDLDVFKVIIQHTEGKPPTAQLTIAPPRDPSRRDVGARTDAEAAEIEINMLTPGQRFFLAYRHNDTVHLLFAGCIQNEPRPVEDNLWALDLIVDSSMVDLKPLQEPYKFFPHWDPLFLSSSQQDAVQGIIPHYSRTEAKVQMVDPFQSVGPMQDLQNQFYQDTLVVRQKKPPYRKIHGEVTVEWVQRYHGLTDISRMLVRELPEGAISTLTADDFQKRWWKPQQAVKQTGYKVVQAHLTSVIPATVDGNPRQSGPFMVNGQETTLPCHWFEPTLVVEWHYRQKRREVLQFTLENLHPSAIGEHTIAWHLQDITADTTTPHWQPGTGYAAGAVVQYGDKGYRCLYDHKAGAHFAAQKACWESLPQLQCALDAPWRSSFLTISRGQRAFEHALYQVRCLMLAQQRSTEICFSMDLVSALQLDLGQQIQLTDTLQGKVIQYVFMLEGDTGTMEAHVTLAQTNLDARKNIPVVPAGYISAFGEIAYKPYEDLLPKHGILNPQTLRSEDLVKAVIYQNLAAAQNVQLQGQIFPSLTVAQDRLSQHRTALQIHLQDLVSNDVLEHRINVEILSL